MEIYTIGFTKRTAADFFGALRDASIEQVVDVRLNNVSQLAGFTKRDDLAFFLAAICDASYMHEPLLAPSQAILDRYRREGGSWNEYEQAFLGLLSERRIEDTIDRSLFEPNTVATRQSIKERIIRTLQQWEPRIVVEAVDVEADPADEQAAIAAITYQLVATSARERMNVSVTLAG